jgi:hypothetical protein
MDIFKRFVDFITLGSPRPIRRLLAYYAVLAAVMFALHQFLPIVDRVVSGAPASSQAPPLTHSPQLLEDGLAADTTTILAAESSTRTSAALVISRTFVFLATLALMLPVSWVYMSARRDRAHNQSVVQTLLILPMVVAGVILIVRDSLALAFSLAGVVAAVRFRTSLSDARDVVFIFLAIAVGFAAGVETLSIAVLVTVLFNFVLVLIWRYDFGRNVLAPTAGSEWAGPLNELAAKNGRDKQVPDRDIVLALTPAKVGALSERFNRVKGMIGTDARKPRYNAILTITTSALTEAQKRMGPILDTNTKRWKLDEVVTNEGKPSQIFFLVRTRKSLTRDALLTEIRSTAGAAIYGADLEVGDAVEVEQGENHDLRKQREKMARQ